MQQMAGKKSERIDSIDVLRGFTLLGIILVHFTEQYYAGRHPQKYAGFTEKSILDNIVSGFTGIFVTGKFYMIFSFLFGLSFYLQLSKSNSGPAFFLRFVWRLVILFAIGFIHSLHYRGDILTIYAVLGLGLLVFYRFPDKALLVIALLLTLNLPSVINRGIRAIQNTEVSPMSKPTAEQTKEDKAAEIYYETVKSGSYLQIIKANAHEFKGKVDFQFLSGRIYITLGLFLLGLYAGRKKIFENLELYRPFFKKLIQYSLWSLLGCIVLVVAFFGTFQMIGIPLPQSIQWMVGGLAYDVFNAAIAGIYSAGILLLFQKEKWRARLIHLYPVGRMGLTTYLMQTLFGFFIFFGVGFGLIGEIGSAVCFGLGLVLFLFQIIFSKWWLGYFRFGIFEWLWRTLTYLKIQPLKRKIEPRLGINPADS
jgi:uncharacterized protein